MAASRLKLQTTLEEMLGSRSVYYQTPESVKMEYPCIRYSKSSIDIRRANNSIYSTMNRYEIIVIDKKADNPVIEQMLTNLPYCSYDRHYVSDNLHHDVLTLYY